MAKTIYDVIGTGAGGGMAIKTLCEAGLKTCALNAGRRLDPEKDRDQILSVKPGQSETKYVANKGDSAFRR